MHFTESDYTSMALFKLRQRELIEKAEGHRLANQSRNPIVRRVRRAIRINNNA